MIRLSRNFLRLKRGSNSHGAALPSHDSNEVVGSMRTGYFNTQANKGDHIDVVAQRLGFERGVDMYPAYPLEKPPKLWFLKLRKGYFPGMDVNNTQKNLLRKFGLSHGNTFSVCMNTANNNDELYNLKRWVKVQPLLFPDGEPTSAQLENLNPSRISIDEWGNCNILPENHPDVVVYESITDTSYRRCTGCINDECEDMGVCRRLFWNALNTPLDRIRDQLTTYELSEQCQENIQKNKSLKHENTALNDIEDLLLKELEKA